ncbi:phosphotransferase family protein [Plantactinospora siamensis]|uniref:Phosphotransferase family protein n=1 Tax=Plantactinospora siamensis TaxID=555372 RepID=A0ABV6P4M3_9ACTN
MIALRSVEELTPDWCSAALARRIGPARVRTVAASPLGTGQMADTYRLRLGYEPPAAGPASCVVKLTATAPASRTAAQVMRAYEVETRFYQQLAPRLPVRTPYCHAARYDARTRAFTVLLEDVAGRAVDQVRGCTATEVDRAVDELAALHGPMWASPALSSLAWLPRHDGPGAAWMASLVRRVHPRFLRRFGARLRPEVIDLLGGFVPRVERYLRDRPGPRTVVHGDFRADNLVPGGRGRMTVLDWQTAAHEPPATDLAYFLGASVEVERRRDLERSAVRRYVAALTGYGVSLSVDDCWRDYRRYAFGGLVMAIVGSTLVTPTERGDDMFATMTNRHGAHAIDLDSISLLR